MERGLALLSLSRFRSYGGAPMDPETVLEGGALVAAQERVRGQLHPEHQKQLQDALAKLPH